jgi:Family of unknown function (DUF6519)
MKADLTRRTFDPLKHFTRVLMQQGRVQLDADWNEQSAELLHYLRVRAGSDQGSYGSRGPRTRGLTLGAVCGLKALTTVSSVSVRHLITYLTQPDYPVPETLKLGKYQVYLDVWERP